MPVTHRMLRPSSLHPSRLALGAIALAALSGCAQFKMPGAKPDAAAATPPAGAASSAAARPAAPPVPGQPQPFATVIKDAKKIDGLITAYQKDDKVWLELRPEDFGRPLLLAPKIAQGIGEQGLYGGTVIGRWGRFGRAQLVEFRRVHNQVQLVARNTEYSAAANTPEGRAVKSGFSPSLLGSTAVASQAHPERKSVLVEANPLFLQDMLALGIALQRGYRQGYGFDRGNSAITQVRGKPGEVVFEVQAHFASAGLAQAQPGQPGPAPSMPMSVPDARSLFFGLHYSLAALPENPMVPRRADARVGYFSTNVADFSNDIARSPQQRFVNRWRLEKKDPNAALSEPVKPIVFWLDRTIPLKYRDAISKGVLGWNAAFERIGFKDAVQVKVQPDDADWDTLDVGTASIRWMTNAQPTFGAIGPSQTDPRTGEILDADIGFESLSARALRAARSQILASKLRADWPALLQAGPEVRAELASDDHGHAHASAAEAAQCQHAEMAAEQLAYALDVLAARGEIEPDSPEAEQFVLDYLTDTTLHEVGHTLGLRHNFRSSVIYSPQQIADADFVRANGLAGSVMEYAPINLAAPGERPVVAWQTGLGPYDYWAIEYGYKPIAPEQEAAELQRIAGRSAEPQLAYGTDEDNFLGIDPEAIHFDLGNDPVAFAKKRLAIVRDLIARQSQRTLKPEADYSVLRRSVTYAVREMGRAGGVLARQIGGVKTLRDHPGSGRDPMVPANPAVQRAALDVLVRDFFAADAIALPPALQRRLAPDYLERTDAMFAGESALGTEYSLASVTLDMQRALLAQLMSDGVAQRLLDSEGKALKRGDALRVSELYERLQTEIWSELGRGGDIPTARRELQREYASRLASLILRPAAAGRADARSHLREQARALLARLEAAGKGAKRSPEARAHLADSAEQLRQALAARISRPV